MDPVITLSKLTKYYRRWGRYRWQSFKGALLKGELFGTFQPSDHILALEGVDLEIKKGEMVGVIGRNGSGKSTLLKIMAGLVKPNSGEVSTRGKIAALIELGAGFHPEISGEDNVMINGVMLGLSRREVRRRMQSIIDFAELADFMDEPVKSYSSGMYVRLGFSVAVHVDADILLVDEVLAVGDESFSRKCIDRILALQAKGVTLLFVSHDLDLVRRLCQRVLWLDGGKVKGLGRPDKIIQAYLDDVGHASEEPAEERHGGGEASITAVRVLNGSGVETSILPDGEMFQIQIECRTEKHLEDFAFGIAIYRRGGHLVYGTNTDIDGFTPREWQGDGRVTFTVKSPSLTPGNFTLDVAIHSRDGQPFDYWKQCSDFTIHGAVRDEGGFRPDHSWSFSSEICVDLVEEER